MILVFLGIFMINELLFITQTIIISMSVLIALALGQSALIAFVCVQCILANLFVVKQIVLFGFAATSSDVFTVGAVLGLNLLQEYYGRAITRLTIWINFFLLSFYAIISYIQLAYLPHSTDTMHKHFVPLLQTLPRIVIASFIVYLLSQFADYALYGFLKKIFHKRFLILRNYLSIFLTQLLDTVLFSILGLYGIIDNIGEVIIMSYTVKIVAIICATPFIGFSKYILQWSERYKASYTERS